MKHAFELDTRSNTFAKFGNRIWLIDCDSTDFKITPLCSLVSFDEKTLQPYFYTYLVDVFSIAMDEDNSQIILKNSDKIIFIALLADGSPQVIEKKSPAPKVSMVI
jgi:hypothetical protein